LKSIPMQPNTHPCIAPPSSSKLRAKQDHATSAKAATNNHFPCLTSSQNQISNIKNQKSFPSRPASTPRTCPDPVRALVGALRPLRATARPGNAGRESSVPQSPITNLPLRPLPEISGFTLIELMAATTVLSVVLLMMVGMQDQMSKAWANANRRTESTREARAGLRMLTEDFTHYYVRSDFTKGFWSRANYNPITNTIPIVYFSDASSAVGKLTISNAQPKSQALFFLSQRRPGTNRESDRLTAVGYYIAGETNMSISGFTNTSYNLYRYVNTNTVSALINFTDANDVRSLFPNVGTTFKSNNEILARNAVNLRIYFYPASSVTGGLIYGIRESDTNITYTGNRCVFEVTTYPDSIANSLLQGNLTNWTSPNNIKRYGRTFEVTMDLERWLPDQR